MRPPSGVDRLPSGKWRARYRDADGARHQATFDRLSEAAGWLNKQRAAVDSGTHVSPTAGSLTFEDYARDRMAAWRKQKPSTRAQVESHLRVHVLPHFGSMPLGKIRPAHVEAWVTLKATELAPSTLHVVFTWMRRVLADAQRAHLIVSSPCDGIELPEKRPREVQPLTLDQIDGLLENMPDHLRCAVLVSAWSGLRSGEVLGLRRHRLDLLGRRDTDGRRRAPSIFVVEQLQALSGPPVLVPPKTKRSERRVPIPRVLVDGLAAHLQQHPTEPEGFVFRTLKGDPIRRARFNESWNRAVIAAGLPAGTYFHDLRHTYASLLIHAGESVKTVSARLGHASAVETLETYAHLWPDSDEHTVTVLDAAYERHGSQRGHTAAGGG